MYNIAWIPCNPELSNNRLFELTAVRDNAIERFVEARKLLEKNGIASNTIDVCKLTEIDIIIFYGINSELRWLIWAVKNNPYVKFINIPIEPAVVSPLHDATILSSMPFDRILVWNDELVVKGLPFVKANIGEAIIQVNSIPCINFNDKKFLVAIYSNKFIKHENGLYEERIRALDFFSDMPMGIDLYGMGWDKSTLSFIKTSYKGNCDSKKDILMNYKFSICFENAKGYPGLITEKIFDCFAAGTVPIYYGCPNITDYIPENCYIDFRCFKNYEHLYDYLLNITEDEYQKYLEAAKDYINSDQYYEFTSKRYAEVVMKQIKSLLHVPKSRRSLFRLKWSLLRIVLMHPSYFIKHMKGCRRFLFDLATAW